MLNSTQEIAWLIHQFLKSDSRFKDTIHEMEKEMGMYFDMTYFEEIVMKGEWDEVERYLLGFMIVDSNRVSTKMFFEIRKIKYYDALDRHDFVEAREILLKDLKPLTMGDNEDLYKELVILLALDDIRENEELSKFGDVQFRRNRLVVLLRRLIELNPLTKDKLQVPSIPNNRLLQLINQCSNWQFWDCKEPGHQLEFNLFVDHCCGCLNAPGTMSSVPNHLVDSIPNPLAGPILNRLVGPIPNRPVGPVANRPVGSVTSHPVGPVTYLPVGCIPNLGGIPPRGVHGPSQPAPTHPSRSLAEWIADPSCLDPQAVLRRFRLIPASNTASGMKRLRPPPTNNPGNIDPTAGTAMKKSRPFSSHVENVDYLSLAEVNIRSDDTERFEVWKPSEISDPLQLHCLRLQDPESSAKILKLIYTNAGDAVWTLSSNAVIQCWKRTGKAVNVEGKASAVVASGLVKSSRSLVNEIGDANPEESIPCLAVTNCSSYALSTSGGKVSVFNLVTSKSMHTMYGPPPAVTSLAFHPQDNNVFVLGLSDSFIHIYDIRRDEVKTRLSGHNKKAIGLAFSNLLRILVTYSADSMEGLDSLCVWSTNNWQMQVCRSLMIPSGRRLPNPQARARLQFHKDQTDLLVVHEAQIAVYEAPKLTTFKQWIPDSSVAIMDASYSCDGQSIFVCLDDGTLAVLSGATVTLRCLIKRTAYLPPNVSARVHPLSVAAHPSLPNQFAVGLSDGAFHVLQPREGTWGVTPPLGTEAEASISSTATTAQDRPSR